MFRTILTIGIILLLFAGAMPRIIQVPANYSTIQAGINAAVNGDTVLVANGIYYEHINFKGKAITVASHFLINGDTTHIASTVIDGSQLVHPDSGSVVYFVSGEDTNSVLCGFKITSGMGTILENGQMAGGGIFCHAAGARICHNLIINNQVFNFNDGRTFGGGIFVGLNEVNRFVILANNRILRNEVIGSLHNVLGGGIYFSASGRIEGNTIDHNVANYQGNTQTFYSLGGGLICRCEIDYPNVLIRDNMITFNQALSTTASLAGGVDIIHVRLEFFHNLIAHNSVKAVLNRLGAGMRVLGSAPGSVVENNIFTSNFPEGGEIGMGGALFLSVTDSLLVRKNRFDRNRGLNGGGVGMYTCTNISILQNEFVGNRGLNYGAIGVELSTGCLIQANRIVGNSVASNGIGGGIGLYGSQAKILNNVIVNDTAAVGGGICLWEGSMAEVVNNTIIRNKGNMEGGGIYLNNSRMNIFNTILWDNVANTNNEIGGEGDTLAVAYSDVKGGWPGDGNLDFDPLFADSLFQLSDSSKCIGTGMDSCLFGDEWCYCPDTDMLNLNRPMPRGTRPDMGALEHQLLPLPTMVQNIAEAQRIKSARLWQNYPNPFNPGTIIEFTLPKSSFVSLKVYNILGEEVATILSKKLSSGNYKYEWNARGMSAGVYFCQLRADNSVHTRKMILLQ